MSQSGCRVLGGVWGACVAVGLLLGWASVGLGLTQAGTHHPIDLTPATPYVGSPTPGEAALVWTETLSHPGATYIALHFTDFELAPGDILIVSDGNGLQSYTLEGRGKQEAGTFWARHIKGDTVMLQLVAHGPAGGAGFRVDEYVAGHVDLGPAPRVEVAPLANVTDAKKRPRLPGGTEAICGADDKLNAICYADTHPVEYDHARAVARLLINGSSLCTGWLASPFDHLITNEHCITTAEDALNADYEFMAEAPNCSDANCQLCFDGVVYSGATLIDDSASHDFALVQLNQRGAAGIYGFLRIANRPAVVDEQIYIPQHPGGRAKEMAINSTDASDEGGVCRVYSTQEPACTYSASYYDIGYFADTEGGSSGSPVLATADHSVIALHHCANCPNRAVPATELCGLLPEFLCNPGLGVLILDEEAYACDQPITITLWDGDLIGEAAAVTVSATGGDLETVALAPQDAGSGVFVATLTTSTGAVVTEDGVLQAGDGQTVTVTYDNLDNGSGEASVIQQTALVDCAAPVISNVQVALVGSNAAVITFTTNEPCTGAIKFGTSCSQLLGTATGTAGVTSHRITLLNLAAAADYAFAVEATDAGGNTITDTNAGQCYAFSTLPLADDYFTEEFAAGDNDLSGRSVLLVPALGTANGYVACTRGIDALPSDPMGGLSLGLSDDSYAEVTVDSDERVSLYGMEFDHFFVASNGTITFGEGDLDYLETPENHFRLPRIAALFDDLNPSSGGDIVLQEFLEPGVERVVVTWLAVPEYESSLPNTFQVEMFYDGRIRLSWLLINAGDGIAGLSAGFGVPTNFPPESDLSDYDACPAPSLVAAESLKTHGAAGAYGIDLMTPGGAADVPVEPRVGGPTRLRFTFDEPVMLLTGSSADIALSDGSVDAMFVADDVLTVDLHGVANATRLSVTFPGLISVSQMVSVPGSLCLGVLEGDVDQNGYVQLADLLAVRNGLMQPVNGSTFHRDINAQGTVDVFDLLMVRNNLYAPAIYGQPCP